MLNIVVACLVYPIKLSEVIETFVSTVFVYLNSRFM